MNEEEKRLLIELDIAREESQIAFKNVPEGLSLPQYMAYMEKSNKKVSEASRRYRMVQTPKYSEMPKFGDVMSLQDFLDNVECGWFIDYDGSGNYVKDGMESNITVYPSDVKYGAIRTDFDTIVWYNR